MLVRESVIAAWQLNLKNELLPNLKIQRVSYKVHKFDFI